MKSKAAVQHSFVWVHLSPLAWLNCYRREAPNDVERYKLFPSRLETWNEQKLSLAICIARNMIQNCRNNSRLAAWGTLTLQTTSSSFLHFERQSANREEEASRCIPRSYVLFFELLLFCNPSWDKSRKESFCKEKFPTIRNTWLLEWSGATLDGQIAWKSGTNFQFNILVVLAQR